MNRAYGSDGELIVSHGMLDFKKMLEPISSRRISKSSALLARLMHRDDGFGLAIVA